MSFSQHAAQTKEGCIFYFLLFLVHLPVFGWFLYGWFIPNFNLSWVFMVFVSLAIAGQAGAVTVPETSGWKVPVHRFFAFAMALMLLPLVVIIGFNTEINILARIVGFISGVFMLATQILYNLNNRYPHEYFLVFQATYVALFHLTILFAAYI